MDTDILIRTIMPFVMLTANAARDLKSKVIFPFMTMGFIAIGLIWQLFIRREDPMEIFMALSAGIIMLAASFITKGGVGKGDGITALALGALAGSERVWLTLIIALGAAAAAAAVMKIRKSDTRELPFVPFILPAFGIVLIFGG